MDQYQAYLKNRFYAAEGITGQEIYVDDDLFHRWLKKERKNLLRYKEVLESLNLQEWMVEFDKGYRDSVVPFLQREGIQALAVSRFFETSTRDSIAHRGSLNFLHGEPIICYERELMNSLPNCHSFYGEEVHTLLTQFPISNDLLEHLTHAALTCVNVVVGAYGSINDKDWSQKVLAVQKFGEEVENMSGICPSYWDMTMGDTYIHLVETKRTKVLRLRKIL